MGLFNNTPAQDTKVEPVSDKLFSKKEEAPKKKSSLFSKKSEPTPVVTNPVVSTTTSMFGVKNYDLPITDDHKTNGLTNVLELRGIRQVYHTSDKDTVLFDNFNFKIEDLPGQGQFVALLGKSGCGKSTILRYMTGLQKPTAGEIYIYGRPKTDDDHIPMVFQQYSSFHWKSVIENVALPMLLKGTNKSEAFDRAAELLKVVGLTGQENKWAKYPLLSGGQLQRVAIARSLAMNSQICVLDEPFSALDIKNRNELQNVLLDIFYNDKIDVTFVLVTHDIREAVYLANRLYVMKANPGDIYKSFEIDFGPQRRTRDTKYQSDYVAMTKQIEEVFNELN